MRKRITNSMRRMSCLACLTVAVLANNDAISGEDAGARAIVCAEREVLLMVLVEAHGALPNAASDKMAAEGMMLMQARTACDRGQVGDATMLYDRLIAGLIETSLAQNNQ